MRRRPVPDLPPEAFALHGPVSQNAELPRSQPAEAIRDLIDLLMTKDLDDEVLQAEAVVLRGVVDRLEQAGGEGRRSRTTPDIFDHPGDFFPNSPMSGWANPLSPPISIWAAEDEDGRFIQGRAIFTIPYEGPPTCVHGGMVALLFDEILGNANLVAGRPGMTGTLTVRYRRPTPLLTPLELEARQVSVDGRKIHTVATISVNGEVTAEATAVFIEVPPTQMLGIVERNAERADGDVIDPLMRQAISGLAEG